MNLLGPGELGEGLLEHVLEALAAVAVARGAGMGGRAWLDVGSGAGLPGLVVSVVWDGEVELVEPREKRVAFLRMALGAVGGVGRRVWSGRVEHGAWRGEGPGPLAGRFGVASARAVFDPRSWVGEASWWLARDGLVLVHLPLHAALDGIAGGLEVVGLESAGRWSVAGLRAAGD